MTRILSLLTLVFISLNLDAQSDYSEGYIIKNNGDSIVGLVYYGYDSKFEKSCRFKRFEIAQEVTYNPGMIKAYGFKNGRRFESKLLRTKAIFLECLVKGPVSLYASLSKKNVMFVESNLDGFVRLNQGAMKASSQGRTFKTYKEYLAWITRQDINTANVILATFSIASVTDYLLRSNRSSIAFHQTTEKNFFRNSSLTKATSRWQFGFTGGYQLLFIEIPGKMSIRYFNEADYNLSYRPVGGVFINRRLSRMSDLVSIELAAVYFSDTYYGYAEYKDSWQYQDDIFLKFSAVQVPVSLRFILGKNETKVRPIIKAGAYKSFLLNSDYMRISDKIVNNSIYSYEFSDFALQGDFGIHASTGIEIPIGYRKMAIEAGYSHGWQKMEGREIKLNTKVASDCFQIMVKLSL